MLILANGIFAGAELALLSVRKRSAPNVMPALQYLASQLTVSLL